MAITKKEALMLINQFGRKEIVSIIKTGGGTMDIGSIEEARYRLLLAMLTSIKAVKELLPTMIQDTMRYDETTIKALKELYGRLG